MGDKGGGAEVDLWEDATKVDVPMTVVQYSIKRIGVF